MFMDMFVFTEFVDVIDVTEFHGGPSGPIFFDQLHCNGEEASLSECSYTPVHMCSHHDDVAIICHRKMTKNCLRVHAVAMSVLY